MALRRVQFAESPFAGTEWEPRAVGGPRITGAFSKGAVPGWVTVLAGVAIVGGSFGWSRVPGEITPGTWHAMQAVNTVGWAAGAGGSAWIAWPRSR